MKELINKIITGVDGIPSSKRVLMLWIGIIIWSFVHAIVFIFLNKYVPTIGSELIAADKLLIIILSGANVAERIWGNDAPKPQ